MPARCQLTGTSQSADPLQFGLRGRVVQTFERQGEKGLNAIGALKIARKPAAASMLYGFAPGTTLATVTGVPIEGPVMR
ncbi:hypothetical protein ACFSVK_05425 [Azorhizophilus paspali]|uniref:hypothetical protein n=1 Tax=Azorhizophilus paspali TaxID=69963 RepID=UPI00364455B3